MSDKNIEDKQELVDTGSTTPETRPEETEDLRAVYEEDKASSVSKFYREVVLKNVGLSLVALAQFFNSLMIISCKLLESDPEFEVPMNPFQILFVRMSVTFLLCILYMKVAKVPDSPWGPPELRIWLFLRGVTGFFGVFGLYFSLQYLSVSDATVIIFLSPTITAILAWVILKERYSLVEAVGGIASLIGVLLIARPTFIFGEPLGSADQSVETSDPLKRDLAVLVLLLGAFGAGSVLVVIRFIGKRLHALISVTYFALWCCLVTFVAILVVPSLTFQIPHTAKQWFYFLLIGFSGFIMQFCLTTGVQHEKAGRSSLMTYTQMIWALIWEVTIWHHLPPLLSWLGFFIIIGSAICVIYYKPKEQVVDQDEEIELSSRP